MMKTIQTFSHRQVTNMMESQIWIIEVVAAETGEVPLSHVENITIGLEPDGRAQHLAHRKNFLEICVVDGFRKRGIVSREPAVGCGWVALLEEW